MVAQGEFLEAIFRRDLFYPLNYGAVFRVAGAKVVKVAGRTK